MQRGLMAAALAAVLALGACGKGTTDAADKKDDKDSGPGVALSADDTKAMGITVVTAQAASYRAQISGYGMVMSLDSIAQSDADVITAQAAALQSLQAANRAKELSTGADAAVSREVYESAAAKAAADQAALALANRKANAAFGQNAPWQNESARAAIMARLQGGRSVVVRVTFPLGAAVAPKSLTVSRLGANAKSWTTSTVWDAPSDPTIPGHGVFALVDGSDLAQGERITASVPTGQAVQGVDVPATALVISDSADWVYMENADNHYLRARIDTSRPEGDGYFVPSGGGIAPGTKIVTNGAGLLLSREINPSTDAGD